MIAIVLGPDAALARATVREISLASDPDQANTTLIDGKAVSVNDVMMAAASIGFFSAERTIVVEDLIARHAKGTTGKAGDADWAMLFSNVPASTTLILVDSTIPALPAIVKRALPADARITISDPPRGRDLVQWVMQRTSAEGGSIDQRTATALLNVLYPGSWGEKSRNPAYDRPPDMDALGNEIAKLVTAALPGPVTQAHITDLTDAGESDNVFAFIDAATAGNLSRAVPALDALLANGDDPHRILAQWAGHVELAAIMAAAGRRDPASVGKDIKGSNPSRLSAVARGLSGLPAGGADRAARVLEDTDRRMKTGEIRDPVDALYAAITGIAAARRG